MNDKNDREKYSDFLNDIYSNGKSSNPPGQGVQIVKPILVSGPSSSVEQAVYDESSLDDVEDDVMELGEEHRIDEIAESEMNKYEDSVEIAESVDSVDDTASRKDDFFELQDGHVVKEGESIPPAEDTPVDHAFDFGTPGMVFDDEPADVEAGSANVETDPDYPASNNIQASHEQMDYVESYPQNEATSALDSQTPENNTDSVSDEPEPPVPVVAPFAESGVSIPQMPVVAPFAESGVSIPQMPVVAPFAESGVSIPQMPVVAPFAESGVSIPPVPVVAPFAESGVSESQNIPAGESKEQVFENDRISAEQFSEGSPEEDDIPEEELGEEEIEEVVEDSDSGISSPLPGSSSGRPVDSFFKNDKLASAQASLKLKAQNQKNKGKQEWWASIFDDEYLMLLPERTAYEQQKQIEYIQKTMGLPPGALLLDLACGNGRNSIGMAQKNYRIVGVDLSLSMLARAGEAAQEAGQKINFIHGDMRDLGFEQTFDGVYCLDTSFGFFDEATNVKVLQGVYRALKPGGVFLLELSNRDFVIRQQPNMVWFQMDNMVCMEETDFNYINSRLYISRQLIIGDNDKQSKHEFSLRLYALHEIGQLLHNVGFAVLKVSGHRSTSGAFFGPESTKMVIVAERRGE